MALESPIRFGILGCARISRKLCRAITLAPNATLSAVASRSYETAAAFAAANNLPSNVKLYGSYESLLDDATIDAVYLPMPTGLRAEWACRAAQRKKHILLEKPVGVNVMMFDNILEACKANGVQLMDGTMWMHHPRTLKMREFLSDEERFGMLKTVHSCFTFAASEDFLKNDIRVKPGLDGLGALGDLGWYCVRSILWAADYALPKSVVSLREPVKNDEGVILACGASMQWGDGKTATFYCSFLADMKMDVTVVGTIGNLSVTDFVIPYEEKECSFASNTNACFDDLVTSWISVPSQHRVAIELPQEACMVQEFARLVGNIKRNGDKPDQTWPDRSRKTQVLVDAVKLSMERNFEPIELSEVV